MSLWRLKGRADYAGACSKSFDIVVESFDDDSHFDTFRELKNKAILAKYPDWKCINIDSWEKL